MAKRNRRLSSIKEELIAKSREAALNAIRTFNDPQVTFKSETYIVLMIIAWTYLMHAFYRGKGIEYRYYRKPGKRKIYDKTKHGLYKHWELERCLNDKNSPIDNKTAINLRFLIGLRHEIEHQMSMSIDGFVSGRYQACAVNFNNYIKKLFGKAHGLDTQVAYSIQFLQLSEEQLSGVVPEAKIPEKIRSYITEFDGALTHEEYNDPKYSFRLVFKKKLVNRPGQADRVIEFIDPDSDLAKQIDQEYWVKKEVERKKYRATDVVKEVKNAGFKKFRINPEHVQFWKSEDAKNLGKGFGTEVQGSWYWYQSWVDRCLELCELEGDRFR